MKVSILALSVLVGGAVLASAANSKFVIANSSYISITNTPLIWSTVSQLPTSVFYSADATNLNTYASYVDTDGSGKIDGIGNVVRQWYLGGNLAGVSSLIGEVKGTITASKMNQPKTQITIKASGYTAPTTNLLVINGTAAVSGPATLNVKFSSSAAPLPYVTSYTNTIGTNVFITSYTNWHILGTYKGTFKSGIKGIPDQKIDEAADLFVNFNHPTETVLRVVKYGNKFGVIATSFDYASGSGNVNSKNQYTVNLKAGGSSSVQMKGQIGAFVYVADPIGTNAPVTNSIVSISTAEFKGKTHGQAINGSGAFWQYYGRPID